MNIHLFLASLKAGKIGIISWSVLIALYGLLVMYLYPSVKDAGLAQYYLSLPEPLKQMIGVDGLLTPEGKLPLKFFVSAEFLSFAPVLVTVYAIFSAGNIAAKEAEMGTLDLILSQPIARTRFLTSKFAVILAGLAAVNLGSMAGLALGMNLITERMSLPVLALALLQSSFLVLAVACISMLFSCIFLNPRKALASAGVFTAASYILNFMAPSLGSYQWVERLSVFHYYRSQDVISKGVLDWGSALLLLAVAAGSFLAAVLVFRQRDIVS